MDSNNISGKQNSNSFFKKVAGLRTVSISGTKILFENESYIQVLGFTFMVLGVVLFFDRPEKLSLGFSILLGIISILFGNFFVKFFGIYSVLDLSNNSFYTEYRLESIRLFKKKSTLLSDIIELGIDHGRSRSIFGGFYEYPLLKCIFYLFRNRPNIDKRKPSKIDGFVEKTAIACLTKDGKIVHFNSFSDDIDADDINIKFAEVLSSYANIPLFVVDVKKALIANRIGNKFKLTSSPLKPIVIGGGFWATIFIFAILFFIFFVLFFLAYIEVI